MPAEMKIWNIPENLTFTFQKIVLYIWLSHEVCTRYALLSPYENTL